MSAQVIATGPLTLVQDAGRVGYAHLGISESGPADALSHALANRIVGNEPSAATCEVLLGGLALRMNRDAILAVTGAPVGISVNGGPAPFSAPIHVAAGSVIRLAAPDHGLRSYLAVRGGFATEAVLGSRASDPTTGLGTPPLAPGDTLPIGPAPATPVPAVDVPAPLVSAGDLTVGATWGPRDDWFTPAARRAFAEHVWTVSADGDRVGVRLHGEPLARTRDDELPSEGVVRGAVQVPADGQPLVFLADHPTTGGYPVIAVVDDDGIAALAQARPGTHVRFRMRHLLL